MLSGTLRRRGDRVIPKNKGVKGPVSGPVAQKTHFGKSRKVAKQREKEPRKRKYAAREDFLSADELERLFKAARQNSKRDEAILRVGYCKALRASEVGMLDLADYRVRDNTLTFRRLKGSKGGTFPLYTKEAAALRSYLKERGDQPGPLFLSRHGRAISRRMLDHLMKRYGGAARIAEDKRYFHVLKHTRGTHLHDAGEGILMIQHQLGHRDLRNTQRYTHVSEASSDAMFDRLRDRW
jgi:integrase/recombinase XerD